MRRNWPSGRDVGSTADHRMSWLGLDDKAVVIAGAGGIGSVCALGFAKAGARVLVVDRAEDRLQALDNDAQFRARSMTLSLDVLEPGAGEEVVVRALSAFGRLDVAVHCIGTNDRRPVLEFTFGEWERVMQTNLSSAFRLAQAAGRHMVEQGHGRIVLLSSVSGLLAHQLHAPYAASKGAMNQMMRVMAAEWASSGVTVNAVAPGYVETNLTAAYLEKPGVRERLVRLVPAGRLGTPEEVVGPILFLSSEHSRFVTGHVMYVDGGRTLV